ncbi:hypothetical protein Nepgr_019217 [Nepenthes gracilis]|uniref:Probable purine permease n=1 Tax=Nepenthes gracilis TaxID=150966 RepID=A0AAD3SWJ6_NEPGR|nr:hypothetical protein Nepgr_019217 [Nepenthes gracilis]
MCDFGEERSSRSIMVSRASKTTTRASMLLLNAVLLAVGIGGGPLVMRLYYIHGGKRIWLQAWLETAGFPIMIFPLAAAYFHRRATHPPPAKLFFMSFPLLVASVLIGILAGSADYLYAYGVKHIPVSTSSLVLATQLAFTAGFAFLLVKQRFTAYSINAVVLLTMGAAVLAMHSSSDRPVNVTNGEYYMGFFMTLASAAMFAAMLPLLELTYKKSKLRIHYALVMEIQSVLSLSATLFCTVGMLINKDFQAMRREAKEYELGEGMYFVVLVCSALVWQCFYLGAAGVINYGSSLLSGIIIAAALPVTEILAVIFYHEKFQQEKGVSLALSLWGFFSYFYGEYKQSTKINKAQTTELP